MGTPEESFDDTLEFARTLPCHGVTVIFRLPVTYVGEDTIAPEVALFKPCPVCGKHYAAANRGTSLRTRAVNEGETVDDAVAAIRASFAG
jgi:hypothetical protein